MLGFDAARSLLCSDQGTHWQLSTWRSLQPRTKQPSPTQTLHDRVSAEAIASRALTPLSMLQHQPSAPCMSCQRLLAVSAAEVWNGGSQEAAGHGRRIQFRPIRNRRGSAAAPPPPAAAGRWRARWRAAGPGAGPRTCPQGVPRVAAWAAARAVAAAPSGSLLAGRAAAQRAAAAGAATSAPADAWGRRARRCARLCTRGVVAS